MTSRGKFCRDGVVYKLDRTAILERYGADMKMEGRIPDALSGAMGNEMYMCNFDTEEAMWDYYRALMERV